MRNEAINAKLVETQTAKIWLDEDGILYMEVLPKVVLTLSAVVENTDVVQRLAQGKRKPVFIDITRLAGITPDARNFSAGEGVNDVLTALAILIGSPLARAIGNLWLGINKPIFPSRLFTSKEDAIEWLRGFLKEA